MATTLPVLAGMVSTTVFTASMLPMLVKAARTHDLSSYSRGNLVLANVGNAVHSLYVVHLPPGPIWFLHAFYVVTSALMLFWWLRYRPRAGRGDRNANRTAELSVGPAAAAVGVRGREGVGRPAAAEAINPASLVACGYPEHCSRSLAQPGWACDTGARAGIPGRPPGPRHARYPWLVP